MKFTVALRDHVEYLETWAPGVAGALPDYIGRVVPLRIGEIGYTATLCAIDYRNGSPWLTFDLADSDLCWEALAPGMDVIVI